MKAAEPAAARRPAVGRDRSAGRARRRRRTAARNLAGHRRRSDGGGSQGHRDQRRRLGRADGGGCGRRHGVRHVFAAEGRRVRSAAGSRSPRRSTSRWWRTTMSSARAARVASCWRPAATTSCSRTAASGIRRRGRIDVTAGKTMADSRRPSESVRQRECAALGRDRAGWQQRRPDADREPARHRRPARDGVPASAARRTEADHRGDRERAEPNRRGPHQVRLSSQGHLMRAIVIVGVVLVAAGAGLGAQDLAQRRQRPVRVGGVRRRAVHIEPPGRRDRAGCRPAGRRVSRVLPVCAGPHA